MKIEKFFLSFSFFLLVVIVFTACENLKRVEVKKEKIGDIELAYYTRGDGDPLIMIMGFRGTMSIWDPALLEILEKKYKLILFDNRGAGLSTNSSNDQLTIQQMAEDTVKLIQALGYQKAHVLGWSMGTRIAMEMAFNHPDVVDTMILCSPSPGGQHSVPRKNNSYSLLTANSLSEKEGLALLFPETKEGKEAGTSFVMRLSQAIIGGSVPNDVLVDSATVHAQVEALRLWSEDRHVFDQLHELHMPTLVAGGLADVLDNPENVNIVANQIPFAWAAYFPGAGHDFASQYYEEFGELVKIFIETNKGR